MKLKLDENLPRRLVHELSALGHDADSVIDEGLAGHRDTDVWQAAQAEQRLLITQDLDFSDLRRYQPGTHAGLLLVRLLAPGRGALVARIVTIFRTEPVASWVGAFVVATDHKLRVRLPDRR